MEREWPPFDDGRTDGSIVCNTLRPLIETLDILPLPDREFKPMSILGHDIMPLIASRGCSRKCSFCSIHTFYRAVPGKIVRPGVWWGTPVQPLDEYKRQNAMVKGLSRLKDELKGLKREIEEIKKNASQCFTDICQCDTQSV